MFKNKNKTKNIFSCVVIHESKFTIAKFKNKNVCKISCPNNKITTCADVRYFQQSNYISHIFP